MGSTSELPLFRRVLCKLGFHRVKWAKHPGIPNVEVWCCVYCHKWKFPDDWVR